MPGRGKTRSRDRTILVKNEDNNFYAEDIEPKLKVFLATSSHFRSVVNYNKYRLLEKSLTCNGKMAAKTH